MFNKFKLIGVAVLLAATTLMFASCQKTEDKLVGKWKITKAPSDLSDDKGETWTFKEGGSVSFFMGGEDIDGDWSVSNENLTIDGTLDYGEGEKFKISGDFTIDELDKKALSLSGNWTIKFYGESEKIKANYDFEKK